MGNKGIIDGLHEKVEKECIKTSAGDADLWIKIWEELHELVRRGILVEVAHVKAHRTKKEKEKTMQFERFVTEGNEKADELAKAGAMLDEGLRAEVRACYNEAIERGSVRSFAICSQLPLFSGFFVDKRRERMKHRTEWCAEANRYEKWGSLHLGCHDLVRKMDRQGEVLIRCRKCSGYAMQRMGPKLMNCCRLEQMDTKEFGKMVKRIQTLEEGSVPA